MLKRVVGIIISYMPCNKLRVLAYKILGYKMGKNVKIGYRTVLCGKEIIIKDNVKIGRKNEILVDKLYIGANTTIGRNNQLIADAEYSSGYKNSNMINIGEKCLITQGHYLDGSFGIELLDEVWIAGRNSSLWTHGGTREHSKIVIKGRSYIGSESRICTSVTIGESSLVGMGSVVIKSVPKECFVAGNPAKIVKDNYKWYEHWK